MTHARTPTSTCRTEQKSGRRGHQGGAVSESGAIDSIRRIESPLGCHHRSAASTWFKAAICRPHPAPPQPYVTAMTTFGSADSRAARRSRRWMGGATAMRASTTSTTRAEVAELTGANISVPVRFLTPTQLWALRLVLFQPTYPHFTAKGAPLPSPTYL